MYKIGICGKANSGKNTVGKLLVKELDNRSVKFIAFADPLKKMALIAFPEIPRKWLYGSSKYRNKVITGAFKDNVPLTVRQFLIDLGNDFGRKYKSPIWIDNFHHRLQKIYLKNPSAVIVTDVRFSNEFYYLKNKGFFMIKIFSNEHTEINDVSETNQDGIQDNEFDFIIENNGTLLQLKNRIKEIALLISA